MTRVSDSQILLVVGAPRSGTTWLHRMLAAHPDIASMQAELTLFTYLAYWERRYLTEKNHIERGHWQQGAPLLYTADEFYNALRDTAHDVYARVLEKNLNATHILDKHPDYALNIPLIYRLFPKVKVLHIIRDGREVAVSMMSAQHRIGFGEGKIHGAARHWASNVLAARHGGQLLGPGQYLELRYEELKNDTVRQLHSVFKFCNLQTSDAAVAQIASEFDIRNKQLSRGNADVNTMRAKPDAIWKAKLSLEQRWVLDRVAGHLLAELRYSDPGWWAVKRGDKARIVLRNMGRKSMNVLGSAKHAWRQPLAIPYTMP